MNTIKDNEVVRFDEPFNEWTRVELKDGQSIQWRQHWPTEEGYSAITIYIERDGNYLSRTVISEGRDCDGYVSDMQESFADLNEGFKQHSYDGTVLATKIPIWVDTDSERYDAYAQLDNY